MKIEPLSKSQAGQESFVINVLERKKNGFYIEVGAYHSTEISNTWALENIYGWQGISIEIDLKRSIEFRKKRRNLLIHNDATKLNYKQLFQEYNVPVIIDYLQIDIEPARQSFKALISVLLSGHKFNVITFEHDLYVSSKNYLYKQCALVVLTILGMKRVANYVRNDGLAFEDWYINKKIKEHHVIAKNSEWRDIFAS